MGEEGERKQEEIVQLLPVRGEDYWSSRMDRILAGESPTCLHRSRPLSGRLCEKGGSYSF